MVVVWARGQARSGAARAGGISEPEDDARESVTDLLERDRASERERYWCWDDQKRAWGGVSRLHFRALPPLCVCVRIISQRPQHVYLSRERESTWSHVCDAPPPLPSIVSCVLIWLSALARDSFRACHSLCCAHRNDAFGMQTGPSCESPIHHYIVCVGLCTPAVAI